MIKLTINPAEITNLYKQVNLKVDGIKELSRPAVVNEIAKASFVITGRAFMHAMDRHAALNPKKMHHVYEWGKVGNPAARLFVLERQRVLGGMMVVNARFIPSRLPVPINKALQFSENGNKVVSKRSIFRNKADVMESGKPVTFEAKRVLAFMGDEGIKFINPGKVINIMNPGGIETKNAFGKFFYEWYSTHAQLVIDESGLYNRIAKEAAIALNQPGGSSVQVRAVAARISSSISKGQVVLK
jgi:hypothetical protein